jgi:hypothetical protein
VRSLKFLKGQLVHKKKPSGSAGGLAKFAISGSILHRQRKGAMAIGGSAVGAASL